MGFACASSTRIGRRFAVRSFDGCCNGTRPGGRRRRQGRTLPQSFAGKEGGATPDIVSGFPVRAGFIPTFAVKNGQV